jgi:DNA-binding response OmpR family regulator
MEDLPPIQIRGIVIDSAKWRVLVEGRPISFTSDQFRILHLLASNAGRVFTRQQIIERIHGPDHEATKRCVNAQICMIRKKLGDHGRLIQTKPGFGYGFCLT